MLVSLINECGASSMAAGSIGIFDKNEAWTLEIISGHHFAAQRVPDTKFLAQPNMLRIGELVFGPSTEFYTSPGLLEFAKSLGFAAASATTFNFAAAFNAENGNGRQHAKVLFS